MKSISSIDGTGGSPAWFLWVDLDGSFALMSPHSRHAVERQHVAPSRDFSTDHNTAT